MVVKEISDIGYTFFTDNLPAAITVEKVKSALEVANLDPEMARELAKRFCFARAKNHMHDLGLIDQVIEDEKRWMFQLSKRYFEQEGITYEKQAIFWYNKESQSIDSDDEKVKARVEELFARFGEVYLPSDLTKIINKIFNRQKGMIALRRHGAIYFVPEKYRELLDKIIIFMCEISADCVVCNVGASSKGGVKEKAMSMLKDDVRNFLEKVSQDVKDLDAAVKNKDGPKKQERRILQNRFDELFNEIQRIANFCISCGEDFAKYIKEIKTEEINLAAIFEADCDPAILAAVAQGGNLSQTMARIVKGITLDQELPVVDVAKVQAVELILAESKKKPDLPVVQVGAMPQI